MKKRYSIFSITIILVLIVSLMRTSVAHTAGNVLYVKPDGAGSGDCDSWANACELQYVLIYVAVSGNQIWVQQGIHKPTDDTSRAKSLILKNGVEIYGGFNGTETLLIQRDWEANVTILSGDLNGDDNGFTNNGDNSYHVVNGSGTDSSAVLDGFTITGGNANLLVVNGTDQFGGGMYNLGSNPTLSNLIFKENSANYGAAMFNNNSSPTLTNVIIRDNSATRGAGMYQLASSPTLTNVTFYNNTALEYGGGMSNSGSSPVLMNVTFDGNSANYGGGLSSVFDSNPTLTNVTFSGNSGANQGGALYNYQSNPVLTNTTISNNTAAGSGGGIFNTQGSNPSITNSILYGNTGGEIVNIDLSTPVISDSVIQGGYAGGTNIITTDPVLDMLGNNGGFTQTMALSAGSPAIDAGDDANCPDTDQRGVTRPFGSHCDIGAYEFSEPTFADVSFSHPYFNEIEILYANGYTGGCSTSPLMFCPDVNMSRAQSAVFMLRGNFGNTYVPVTPTHFFKDNWKNSSWGEGWAESMYLEGLTAGCSPSPLKFCPDEILTNVQLAVFGLRLKYGMAYATPIGQGTVFADMTDVGFWGTGWAEQAYAEGLIPSCGTDIATGKPKFCPNNQVSRGFGAYVIVNAKGLTMP